MARRNNIIVAFLCIALAGLVFFACTEETPAPLETAKKPVSDTDTVARVGDRRIDVGDLQGEMERRSASASEKDSLLQEMIDFEAMLAKAKKEGLDKDPELIRACERLLVGKFRSKHLTPAVESISVAPEEAREYYENHRDEFAKPPSVRLALLYLSAHSRMSPEKRDSIREKLAGARETALGMAEEKGFGKLSIAFSEHQASRYRGGDIGWVKEEGRAGIDQAAVDAGFSLAAVGDVSEVVEGENGFYVVKLMDRKEASLTPFEKVERKINQTLLLEKRRKAEAEFHENARQGLEIEIYPEVLATVEAKGAGGGRQAKPPRLP